MSSIVKKYIVGCPKCGGDVVMGTELDNTVEGHITVRLEVLQYTLDLTKECSNCGKQVLLDIQIGAH